MGEEGGSKRGVRGCECGGVRGKRNEEMKRVREGWVRGERSREKERAEVKE